MSELMDLSGGKKSCRWQLMTTVSVAVLLGAACGSISANAADQEANRPTVWLELGAQLDHIDGQGDSFPVGFLARNPDSVVLQPTTPLQAQRPVPLAFAGEGKISIQPDGSNWVFSAVVNYGRSNNFRHVDHQTNGTHPLVFYNGLPSGNIRGTDDFSDTQVNHQESHTILDFSAGKDVGLGLFGNNSSSVLSLGVRFAQFSSKATFDVRARPDLQTKYITNPTGNRRVPLLYFHTYHDQGVASRSFRGIGPSLSLSGSTSLVGSPQGGQVGVDWGANAALLFGKQKTHVQHQESGHYFSKLVQLGRPYLVTYEHSGGHVNARSVTVPNVGGFAAATYRIEDFKVSLGYRADFFFGAVDVGIDTRKSETLGFYGPFASISVGLGG